ncbi:MAG: hypothetical protein VXW06_01790 [Pseudomonadota bacterium]|nr:hypothetical protein [Pseudomonadota bacterium]
MQIHLVQARPDEASCPRCHSPLQTIRVHGHEQCAICKSNIFECCSGEQCQPEARTATLSTKKAKS